jgi:hypothetical protein
VMTSLSISDMIPLWIELFVSFIISDLLTFSVVFIVGKSSLT